MKKASLKDIVIRTTFKPGDLGYITFLHGYHYKKEYNYGIEFELIVSAGLQEFYRQYNPVNNRIWICEIKNEIVGSLLLLNRGDEAQLRFFFLLPEYRGIGLGTQLMELYMEFMKQCKYKSSYLWTTNELYAAASLYKKFGFVLTEEKLSIAFGKKLTEQRYELKPEV